MSKEQEYKEIFLAEALESYEELNRLLTVLEKNPKDKQAIDSIFRITHTLKGNALGMGFDKVAEFAHVMEDLFGEVREGNLQLDGGIFSSLYKAADTLGNLVNAVKDGSKVHYRGIKTKLEVLLKNTKANSSPEESENVKEVEPDESKNDEVTSPPVAIDEGPAEDLTEEQEDAKVDEPASAQKAAISFSDLVQVPVRKLDNLLNLVGELVIERDRIMASHADKLDANEYARLNRISSDLQYSVMDVRLVQVGFLFNKFHRVVRDAANQEDKKANLVLEGTETEIDRNILQIISDSLIHLIRNAVGHGMETPGERKQLGKQEEGTITLSAFSESDAVVIEIKDDGKGIDAAKVREKAIAKGLLTAEDAAQISDHDIVLMIFEPGFSTKDEVTAISGRGVGMDVVKQALDSIGGNISVETQLGEGTKFSLRLPSSMAVKGTLLFELATETYAIPLSYTEAVVSLYKTEIHKVGKGLVASYLDKTISIVFLKDLLSLKAGEAIKENNILQQSFDEVHPEQKLDVVIVSYNDRLVGIVVDKLLQQKEIVEKSLTKPFDQVKVISGVTIMGNGHVCLVINVAAICQMIFSKTYTNKSNSLSY